MCARSRRRRTVPVVQQACPLFVPMAEEGLIDGPIVEAVAHRYLDPLLATMPQTARPGAGLHAFSCAERRDRARRRRRTSRWSTAPTTTAEAVAAASCGTRSCGHERNARPSSFLATDAPDRFARVGEIFLGRPIDPGAVELIDLQ